MSSWMDLEWSSSQKIAMGRGESEDGDDDDGW
jgi:hypothetical protein